MPQIIRCQCERRKKIKEWQKKKNLEMKKGKKGRKVAYKNIGKSRCKAYKNNVSRHGKRAVKGKRRRDACCRVTKGAAHTFWPYPSSNWQDKPLFSVATRRKVCGCSCDDPDFAARHSLIARNSILLSPPALRCLFSHSYRPLEEALAALLPLFEFFTRL